MSLEQEIEQSTNEIKTDGYPMSIGELSNLYKDKDLIIFPEFQRYFRWNETQKSDLIESILLGIPIPPIFVAQDSSGKWDVIDGLQRVSTIMEFMGILRNKEDDELRPPSEMIATKFLPSLQGKKWEGDDASNHVLSEDIRRKFKRRKLDIVIIDSTTNPSAKYELFQRLNTNGSELTAQEIRNCIMLMIKREFYLEVEEMANYPNFKDVINISGKQEEEQFDKELITRYLVARNSDLSHINSQEDIKKFLTDAIIDLMGSEHLSLNQEKEEFIQAIDILKELFNDKAFKKYNNHSQIHEGSFSLSVFEATLCGISQNISHWKENKEELKLKVQSIYSEDIYKNATIRGKRAVLRFKELTEFSKGFFEDEN